VSGQVVVVHIIQPEALASVAEGPGVLVGEVLSLDRELVCVFELEDVSQRTPAEKQAVKAAVSRKFPGIKVAGRGKAGSSSSSASGTARASSGATSATRRTGRRGRRG
jgi:hypothetical protein